MFNVSYKCALLLIVFSICTTFTSFSQTFSITPSNTSFTVNTASMVTGSTTINSSFAVNVPGNTTNYSLYAAVISKSYNPSSTVFSPLPLNLSLNGITGGGNTANAVSGNIQLSEAPTYATLGTNMPKASKNGATWNYNVILLPVNFTTAPGTYIFTIQVQMNVGGTIYNASVSITVNVQTVMAIALQQNSSSSITFASATDYTTGISMNNFHSLQVKSNIPWLVSVTAPASFTAASQGADANMPCSIMSIKPTTGSTFIPLSASAQTIKTGIAGDVTASGNTSSFDMRFNPSYNYSPGIYNISLTYTLTNQ